MTGSEPAALVISGPGLHLAVALDPWDTRALGFPVAKIDAIECDPSGDVAPALAQLTSWLDDHGVHLVSCRLESVRLRESMLLEDVGFRFIEMVYSPVLAMRPEAVTVDDDVAIDTARASDRAALEAIAASAFTTGRHVLDWRLDPGAGHDRYRRWLEGALADPGQEVLKASVGEAIVGFFIVESRANQSVYWHLTAVAEAWQGRGVGKRVWRRMIARHRVAGVQRIETTISAHNTAVINLYAGLDFRLTAPRATFHWFRP